MEEFDRLKLIYELPRLYLSDFFIDLKTQIDILFIQKDLKEKDVRLKNIIKQHWIEIIDKVDHFKNECFKNQKTNKFIKKITEKLDNRIKFINENINDKNITDIIEEEIFYLEKVLFMNQTIIFLPNDCKLEKFFKKMNKFTTVGKLIIINEFFSKKDLENLLERFFLIVLIFNLTKNKYF